MCVLCIVCQRAYVKECLSESMFKIEGIREFIIKLCYRVFVKACVSKRLSERLCVVSVPLHCQRVFVKGSLFKTVSVRELLSKR